MGTRTLMIPKSCLIADRYKYIDRSRHKKLQLQPEHSYLWSIFTKMWNYLFQSMKLFSAALSQISSAVQHLSHQVIIITFNAAQNVMLSFDLLRSLFIRAFYETLVLNFVPATCQHDNILWVYSAQQLDGPWSGFIPRWCIQMLITTKALTLLLP